MNSDNLNPLVSVIVITYNSAQYVLETLESIKNQSYKEIELIISDDCSSDNTFEICSKWFEINGLRFIKFRIVTSLINTGIPANCNRGLLSSNGSWIKIIAGDDELKQDCIKNNLDYIKLHGDIQALFSYTNMYLNSFEPSNFIQKFPAEKKSFFNESITPADQYKLLLMDNRVHSTATNFISRNAIESVGGYDERFKHIEDFPMWLKLTKAGYKLHFMEKVTVNYRMHSQAIHNFTDKLIVKPTYIKNERLRKEYTYPNLPCYHVVNSKYVYLLSLLFVKLGLNNDTYFTRKLYQVVTNYLNPFRFLVRIMAKSTIPK